MGGCCSVSRGSDGKRKYCSKEGIGVYVRKSHWAHALIAQNHELCEAIYKDDVRARGMPFRARRRPAYPSPLPHLAAAASPSRRPRRLSAV